MAVTLQASIVAIIKLKITLRMSRVHNLGDSDSDNDSDEIKLELNNPWR